VVALPDSPGSLLVVLEVYKCLWNTGPERSVNNLNSPRYRSTIASYVYACASCIVSYLASGLVVGTDDQLHAIWLQLEALEEVNDVELGGVEGQALHLDDAVHVHMGMATLKRKRVM
jgi:hypothetical protein